MASKIRQPIDVASLENWLSENFPQIKSPIDVLQFTLGQSNPTYQLRGKDGVRYVLRKKPPLKLISKKMHWIEREFEILNALRDKEVPVPQVYCLCTDEGVIGTPFYIMEFLDGRVFATDELPGVSPEDRKEMWQDAVRNLAKLHTLDVKTLDLEVYGQRTEFYERQLAVITAITKTQSEVKDRVTQAPVGPILHSEKLFSFFRTHRQRPREIVSLLHGDFKMDNIMFHKTEPRVIGIFDWEISAIGNPISDLAHLLSANTVAEMGVMNSRSRPFLAGATPGLPSPGEVLHWYKSYTGWDLRPDFAWASIFSMTKIAVICQGVKARIATGQASGISAEAIVHTGLELAEAARRLIFEIERSERTERLML